MSTTLSAPASRPRSRSTVRSLQPGPVSPILYFLFGTLLISLPLAALFFNPELSKVDPIYLRSVAACGGALIGALIPGVLNVTLPAVKAGGAIGVFAIIFFLNPSQKVIDHQHAVRRQWAMDTWQSYQHSSIASIPKPAEFPSTFSYTDPGTHQQGELAYDAGRNVYVEHTVLPNVPYYFFRPVRFDSNTLWIFDDNRGFTIKIPSAGGWCQLASDGLDGHFQNLYQLTVSQTAP